jgi:hypothetical protein
LTPKQRPARQNAILQSMALLREVGALTVMFTQPRLWVQAENSGGCICHRRGACAPCTMMAEKCVMHLVAAIRDCCCALQPVF